MFLLYAIAFGFVFGFLIGGRPMGLAELRLRWIPLALAGFLAQVALFSPPVAERVGDAGPILYVGSTLLVLAAVLRNARVGGMVIVAVGAASNLAAIVANHGFMPASPAAVAALGPRTATGYSNSVVVANPSIAPLTDQFALPGWLPFANVFSIGDLLIGLGVAAVIIAAMRTAGATDGPGSLGAAGRKGPSRRAASPGADRNLPQATGDH
jgi:Family of unknown function (DUF5317)